MKHTVSITHQEVVALISAHVTDQLFGYIVDNVTFYCEPHTVGKIQEKSFLVSASDLFGTPVPQPSIITVQVQLSPVNATNTPLKNINDDDDYL